LVKINKPRGKKEGRKLYLQVTMSEADICKPTMDAKYNRNETY